MNKRIKFILLPAILTVGVSVAAIQTSCNSNNTWTIMMYVCGSNFEALNASPEGLASNQIHKALGANLSRHTKILVETGGSQDPWRPVWDNHPTISTSTLKRWSITRHQLDFIEDATNDNNHMATSSALEHFISWGIHYAPADHYGVVFFDHGLAWLGCEIDYNDGQRHLSINDMSVAFNDVETNDLHKKLDFICFDNCVMSNFENLAANGKYANYIIANEDEGIFTTNDYSGCGIDYASFYEDLDSRKGTHMSAIDLINKLDERQTAHNIQACATLIQCDAIPKLVTDFNNFCGEIDNDKTIMETCARDATNFNNGGGYNLIDLYGWMAYFQNTKYHSENIIADLNNTITYHKHNMDKYNEAHGINIYYPRNNIKAENQIDDYSSVIHLIPELNNWEIIVEAWYLY